MTLEERHSGPLTGLLTRYAGFCAGGVTEGVREALEAAHRPEPAKKDPFIAKFGGPYQARDGVSPAFQKGMVDYASSLLANFNAGRKEGLGDRKAFQKYCTEVVNPALAKLVPANDAEKKMKEAAVLMRDLYGFTIDPAAFKEETTRQEHQAFLDAARVIHFDGHRRACSPWRFTGPSADPARSGPEDR